MSDRLVTCGWCGTEFPLDAPDHDCEPHCRRCGEEYESKAKAHEHDCPEESDGVPTPDHVPESERIERRERDKLEDGRARDRRLGLDR